MKGITFEFTRRNKVVLILIVKTYRFVFDTFLFYFLLHPGYCQHTVQFVEQITKRQMRNAANPNPFVVKGKKAVWEYNRPITPSITCNPPSFLPSLCLLISLIWHPYVNKFGVHSRGSLQLDLYVTIFCFIYNYLGF